jgi:acyl-CoA thioester hydrolase
MTQRYTRRFRVRHYELDALGHVNNAVYVQYMQEAAIEASSHAGFGPEWYRERGTGWVVRRLSVRYLGQATYGEEIEAATWVSQMRGPLSTREYDLTRAGDGARVARGRAQWVYLDLGKGQPLRFPPESAARFAPTEEVEELDVRLRNARPTEGTHRYRSRRRVQFHELDTARHVNHAVYLQWVGQAYFDALRAAGWPPERAEQEGWVVVQGAHDIEYFAPALDNDEIEVVSWVCELGKVRGAWTHEIRHAATGNLLARDYSVGVFLNREGRPTAPPERAVADVLRGPGHELGAPQAGQP